MSLPIPAPDDGSVADRPGPGAPRQPGPSMRTKGLELPATGGPWSVREFRDHDAADAFCERLRRLEAGHPPPVRLTEPLLAPDGRVLPAGSWIVLYPPILGLNAGAA